MNRYAPSFPRRVFRISWFFPVLILLAFRPSALALSEESPVEVTCGIVYSIGTLDAHGGWPRRIQDATRDPSVKYMLHLFYAPFVMVHNPGDKEILYSESELSDAVVFGTPPIALRFERSNGNPTGFVTSVPIALVRMYVRQMYSENPEKTYHFSLADAVNGDTVALAPGETKVFVPDLDENYTVAMDRPGDGNTFYDWRNDKTAAIRALPTHGWRGHVFAYHIAWLNGPERGHWGLNGIIPTRRTDVWNVEVSLVAPLGSCRVFRYPLPPDDSWPRSIPEENEITSFPFQIEDCLGTFSTASIYSTNYTPTKFMNTQPIFAVVLPPESSKLNDFTDRDGNGMDDFWERAHFGGPGASPGEDPDGDGLSNIGEFLADTSPTDRSDFLKAEIECGEGAPNITWNATDWRRYDIQKSSDMQHWTTLKTVRTKAGTAPVAAEPIDVDESQAVFYRIQVRR